MAAGGGRGEGGGPQQCFSPFSTSHASVPYTTALGRPTPRAERSHRGPCRVQVALCVLEVLPAPSLQPVAHSPVPPPPTCPPLPECATASQEHLPFPDFHSFFCFVLFFPPRNHLPLYLHKTLLLSGERGLQAF